MIARWPATDVIADVQLDPDGCSLTARTRLYLEGPRGHIHTATVMVAAERILARLLRQGERLGDIDELEHRALCNRELVLFASRSRARPFSVSTPAITGRYRTDRGRTLYLAAVITDEVVRHRHLPPGIFNELVDRMRLEDNGNETFLTRLDPLTKPSQECTDPVLTRHAIIEFVLEGTRQRIRERFGRLDGQRLVVAGWKHVKLPGWDQVAPGCRLGYRLREGCLSSGTKLVHCDFSFAAARGSGRLTVACIPAGRMRALESNGDAPGVALVPPADGSRRATG